MLRRFIASSALAISAVTLTPVSGTAGIADSGSCESLATLKLPDTTISRAEVVAAGAFTPPANAQLGGGRGGRGGNPFATLPSFCRVVASVKPTTDSDIQIEVWLPLGLPSEARGASGGWNGRFQAAGGAAGANSAVAGGINFPALANSVRAGYATAGTDNGHQGATLAFAPDHPEKLIDFGYRATHEMTVKAKSIIEAFYGNGPRHSYWNACAAGGRQGLQEAQRFPADYDGIVVTAPANSWSRLQSWSMWVNQQANRTPAGVIPATKYPAIHRAVVEQCDMLDGVKDGIIENPERCHPRLDVLACTSEDTASCLTPPQIETANGIYEAAVDAQGKRIVYAAMPAGSELGWAALAGPTPPYYAMETFKYLVFHDPEWAPAKHPINLGADVVAAEHAAAAISADNPDLSKFFARGGKLVQVHGSTDPLIAPGDSVDYYTRVRATVGDAAATRSMRLYLVPGMNHCQGGEGADNINLQPVIEAWVEHAQAPTTVIASKIVDGQQQKTHLLCPYPQEAVLRSSGNPGDAASFECRFR
jgi:feruloyl esterase